MSFSGWIVAIGIVVIISIIIYSIYNQHKKYSRRARSWQIWTFEDTLNKLFADKFPARFLK